MVIENVIIQKVEGFIEQYLKASDYELLSIELYMGKGRGLLKLVVDKEGGITIKDCEDISKKISTILDAEDIIQCPYILEVSSPGPQRVLTKPQHFMKFSGNDVKLILKNKVNNQKNITGTIIAADENGINLKTSNEILKITYSNISKANLKVDWTKWDLT